MLLIACRVLRRPHCERRTCLCRLGHSSCCKTPGTTGVRDTNSFEDESRRLLALIELPPPAAACAAGAALLDYTVSLEAAQTAQRACTQVRMPCELSARSGNHSELRLLIRHEAGAVGCIQDRASGDGGRRADGQRRRRPFISTLFSCHTVAGHARAPHCRAGHHSWYSGRSGRSCARADLGLRRGGVGLLPTRRSAQSGAAGVQRPATARAGAGRSC